MGVFAVALRSERRLSTIELASRLDGLHLEIIKAFTALEVQDFKTLDKLILKRF